MPAIKISPMMKQYFQMKRKVKDAILFFRVGDFYETFGQDAVTVSKELGIVLTSRDKERDRTPMAGVPYHSADTYIARLVRKGYKVAIAEQMEEPSPKKKLVHRDVIRIITPGTIIEEGLLDDKSNNYLASIVKARKGFGLSVADVSTGEFLTTQIEGENALDILVSELSRFSPKECIIPESLFYDKAFVNRLREDISVAVTPLPDYYFDFDFAKETLLDHFKTATLEGFGVETYPLSLSSAGAIISYLIDTQRTNVENIKSLKTYHVTKFMLLDSTTIRNLELLQNFRDGSTHGTLIEVLDQTKSAMGSRLLKKWLLYPLQDVHEIRNRLDAVEELVNKPIKRRNIRSLVDEIYDLERIMSRLNLGRLNPKDLIALKDSLKIVPKISKELDDFETPLINQIRTNLNGLPEIVKLIEDAIIPDPPPTIQEGGVIKDGYNVELDSLRKLMRDAKKVIVEIEQKERNRTGIKSLKIGYNKVFGYYIEVPMTHIKRVPSDYIRKQTLTNAERFITPELKELEEKILTAEERINQLEYELFLEVRDKVCRETDTIQKIANAISELDVLSTFAELAVNYNYTRPEIIDAEEGIIEIKNGRHPVVERLIEENFVPNDVYLDNTTSQIIIVTGPNMAGKSTYIRQVALIVLLAHIGSFVPAKKAKISLVDRIFTRVGAVDDISRKQSTFMVEMIETANILNNATSKSLIILDEIGRGTSTFDGLSIAWAVVEYIHNFIGAKTLFATHYHHLTMIESLLERVKNCHIKVVEHEGKMIFVRRVVPGPSDKSYGIHVAKLAGMPQYVIERASWVLKEIESQSEIRVPVHELEVPKIQREKHKSHEEKQSAQEDLLPVLKVNKEEVKELIAQRKEMVEQLTNEKEVARREKKETREGVQETLDAFFR